jgi:hypothetical protein
MKKPLNPKSKTPVNNSKLPEYWAINSCREKNPTHESSTTCWVLGFRTKK